MKYVCDIYIIQIYIENYKKEQKKSDSDLKERLYNTYSIILVQKLKKNFG